MSIKGFSTQKKSEDKVSSYSEVLTKDSSQFITAQKTSSDKVGLDNISYGAFRISGLETAEAGTSGRLIKITGHGASVGDFVRFESGSSNPYYEAGIVYIPDANTLVIATAPPVAITSGDTFYILRYTTSRLDSSGAPIVTVAAAPISFVLDGVDTEVEEDTGTPANSIPLPTKVLDASGVIVDFATSAKQDLANTLLNEISTNTLAIANATSKNTSGSVVNGTLSTTVANSESAPANAVGFILQNESSNTNSIRVRIGGAASTSDGMLLEPGRDTGYIPTATTVSVCNTVSSTQTYSITWVIK